MRISEPEAKDDHHVVVLAELPDNRAQSITNAIEQLAGEIILANALPSTETSVIEHYPAEARPPNPETLDLATFERTDPEPVLRAGTWTLELGEPSRLWIDRRAVETPCVAVSRTCNEGGLLVNPVFFRRFSTKPPQAP